MLQMLGKRKKSGFGTNPPYHIHYVKSPYYEIAQFLKLFTENKGGLCHVDNCGVVLGSDPNQHLFTYHAKPKLFSTKNSGLHIVYIYLWHTQSSIEPENGRKTEFFSLSR